VCGITGIYNYANGEPVDSLVLGRMTGALTHRGPDAEGFFHDDKKGIGFGHRRLTIIDLATGQQPMSTDDRSVWITYNGELYNYREIREALKKRGHAFRTSSDTEVLLKAYVEYGTEAFSLLNGIFAFGLFDLNARRLLIARDHLGVKPVYFYDSGKSFIFASEIKSLLLHPEYSKGVNEEGVDLHVTFRHTPAPHTLFRGIFKMPAGSFLNVDPRGAGKIKCYWDDAPPIDRAKNEGERLDEMNAAVEKAVTRQMVSDVPISLSLSGGVDSNLLLAVLSKHSGTKVNCFTIGFADNEQYDEVALARASAEHFNADLKTMTLSARDYQEMFSKYMRDLEEPLGNESALAYYFVAKLARDSGIKVLLNGQGADELFGGYHRHLGERYRRIMNIAPRFLTKPFSRLVGNERLKRSLYALNENDEIDRFYQIYSVFLPEERMKLYNEDFRRHLAPDRGRACIEPFFRRFTNHSSLDKMLYIDLRFSLPDNLLLAEDKMAMAAGVEARVPFLDIEYVKLAERIPAEVKLRHFQFKHIHKQLARRWLPLRILKRKKIGFTNPMNEWLTRDLEKYFLDLISGRDSFTRQYLSIKYAKKMYDLHKRGRKDFKRNLFLLFSMEQWYRTFFN
jgi:asparagine synthase (glutamine-hydrolysing)